MTRTTQHTPGPWQVRKAMYIGRPSFYVDPVNERSEHDSVCVAVIREHWPVEESEANARLIAAAPALLELAQAVERLCGAHPDTARVQTMATAAIALVERDS